MERTFDKAPAAGYLVIPGVPCKEKAATDPRTKLLSNIADANANANANATLLMVETFESVLDLVRLLGSHLDRLVVL
jgi:hypothetical protein